MKDPTKTVRVSEDADVVLAGRRAKAVLAERAFDESIIEDIVLVVHELASNIVKHAGEGSITIAPRSGDEQDAIEVRAHDSGPGIVDIDQAVVDGYSTAGGLGGGLGAVHRLMDDVVIDSGGNPTSGVEIVATRWCSEPTGDRPSPPLAVGAASRARRDRDKNGDAFLIEHGRGETLVGVIDGLGHGQAAHHAATTARQHVRAHSARPLADLFAGVGRVCRRTRGVVMLLARFDWDRAKVTLGGVGNIALRSCNSSSSPNLVSKRGVLGNNAPAPLINEWSWDPTSILVLHSDGIPSNWSCEEHALHEAGSATDAAHRLLRSLWTREDDATVLVVREASE